MYRVLAIFCLAFLCGCSTPYQEIGLTGGVSAFPITTDVYRIEARGNGNTKSTTIQDYTLLKAAETTKVAGGSHFIVVNSADVSVTGATVLPGQAQTSFNAYNNTATTTYTPPTAINYRKPRQDTYIRVLRLDRGQAVPPGAISADEIISVIGARVKRG